MSDMASCISAMRALLPGFESALQSFAAASAKFCVVRTVNAAKIQPSTLYILDSSFNPPSIAHLTLITSALKEHAYPERNPCRVLLLFSTQNADKAPSPASFAQRIALMSIFAEDLSNRLKTEVNQRNAGIARVPIDVGLTKEPYYNDKSVAIADTQPPIYPSSPSHVYLVGYDTLTRFCNPKYYPSHHPPLSALRPFFDANHKLRVTQRPTDTEDASSTAGFDTPEEQEAYLQSLTQGRHVAAGFEAAWGHQIVMTKAEGAVGVSSTRVRRAAHEGRWDDVGELCTEAVALWIRDQNLYSEESVAS